MPIINAPTPEWRNGRRSRLKICRGQPRGGSTPPSGTRLNGGSGMTTHDPNPLSSGTPSGTGYLARVTLPPYFPRPYTPHVSPCQPPMPFTKRWSRCLSQMGLADSCSVSVNVMLVLPWAGSRGMPSPYALPSAGQTTSATRADCPLAPSLLTRELRRERCRIPSRAWFPAEATTNDARCSSRRSSRCFPMNA